ncbi:MAG: hypothetical protein WCJ63_03690 [Actinomycetes bacterium]
MSRFTRTILQALTISALALGAANGTAMAASSRHCKMATAATPQICATASTGHKLEVVVNGKWVAKYPTATPTGYTFMGGSRTNLAFTPTIGRTGSWTAKTTLPAGRIWTIKITVSNGQTSKVITLMTNIL